jgi:putative flavoprotein involved in K+ transport
MISDLSGISLSCHEETALAHSQASKEVVLERIASDAHVCAWLEAFQEALAGQDLSSVVDLFDPEECFWRDLVAFTWNVATMDGRDAIVAMLRAQLGEARPVVVTPTDGPRTSAAGTEGWFTFETRTGRGRGHVRLRDGRAWTLLTALEELKGHEEPSGRRRPRGVAHEALRGHRIWPDQREEEARALGFTVQPYCLIVGASQGGLALGARLRRLGVPTLLVDTHERPGDAWRNRYRSLHLHDAVWIDHLPYLPFPDHWPVYMHKDKMADWLEMYAKVMELNVWGGATCRLATYDDVAGEWVVEIERRGDIVVVRPKHLVLATGLSGVPVRPDLPGADVFAGVQMHSSEYRGGAEVAGRRCVVLGANNSAHDIAVDLWGRGAEVAMIQRSPTTVLKASSLRRLADQGPYSEGGIEAGITTDIADLMFASMPFRPRERLDRANCTRLREEDAAFYDRLTAAGFLFDFGVDGTGIAGKYPRRASGYYIDVGGSDLIAAGEIKVHSRVGVERLTTHSVMLTDGTEVPADLVVYATGFGPMVQWAELLVSKEVADAIGPCWGLGSDTAHDPGPWEGELRNMWKPTAQDGLWFQGGNLAQSRLHSLHLALQLKARQECLPVRVHTPQPFWRKIG